MYVKYFGNLFQGYFALFHIVQANVVSIEITHKRLKKNYKSFSECLRMDASQTVNFGQVNFGTQIRCHFREVKLS